MIENASEGGRSLSLFPFFPGETSASREEWLSRKKVFEDGVPSPQHVTKPLESLRGGQFRRGSLEANSFLLTYSPKPYSKVVNPFNKKLENMLFQSVTQAAQKKKKLCPPNRSQTYDLLVKL